MIHCFTGKLEEAEKYIDMGFHVGLRERFVNFKGAPLREIIQTSFESYSIKRTHMR